MNMWNLRALNGQRFVNYKLFGIPMYRIKVGDEIMGIDIGNEKTVISGIFKIHSIMWWPINGGFNGSRRRLQIRMGAKGFGETICDIDDRVMVWKATLRRDSETNTKRNEVSVKEFGLRNGSGSRREKWNIPRHGISSAPR